MLLLLFTVTFTYIYILFPVNNDSFRNTLVLALISPTYGFPPWKSAANFKYRSANNNLDIYDSFGVIY